MWNTWWRFQLHEFVKLITEVCVTREGPQLFPLGMHHTHTHTRTHAVWLYALDALWCEGWDVLRNQQESAISASCNVEKVNTNSVVQRWNGNKKKGSQETVPVRCRNTQPASSAIKPSAVANQGRATCPPPNAHYHFLPNTKTTPCPAVSFAHTVFVPMGSI